MNLAALAIKKKTVILFTALVFTIGGVLSYFDLGKLEDPEFTIKTALVITYYPGASASQVEEEVTDVIESAAQQLENLDEVRSMSRPGVSIVYVDIKESCNADQLPQIWDDLRKKLKDSNHELPPGAYEPMVQDDFGDVYGVLLALQGDGFDYAQMKDYAEDIKREILLVKDVARVEIWGEQQECIYLEISPSKMAKLGISPMVLFATLKQQNLVVPAGYADLGRERLRLDITGEFKSVDEIGDLVVAGIGSDKLICLRDIAQIKRAFVEPAKEQMRFNGKESLAIAVSTTSGGNVVDMGKAVKKKLDELMLNIPHGIEIETINFQSDYVSKAINDFMINLIEAVSIVIVVLFVSMGIHSGLLIGSGLIITIATTFLIMNIFNIDLHRISLGSLIVALGMLVDNAIVILEGMLVKMQRGINKFESAVQTVRETAMPLLGATIIAVLAFLPIFISKTDTGEYCRTLFSVVGISLMVSWIIAMTLTPLSCHLFLRISDDKHGTDPHDSKFYHTYRFILEKALHHRIATISVMAVLLVLSIVGFGFVEQMFFPKSTMSKLMVQYWLPEGSRIEKVSEDIRKLEDYILEIKQVESVSSFIGAGPPRFYLPMDPELPRQCYGELIVNVDDADNLGVVYENLSDFIAKGFPHAEALVKYFPLGPAYKFDIEARFRGSDPAVLHRLANQTKEILASNKLSKDVRDDWRQRVKKIVPQYSQPKGRRAGLSRQDVGLSVRQSFDGLQVGTYREDDELLPIIIRSEAQSRKQLNNIEGLSIFGQFAANAVPLGQVVDGVDVEWEDSVIWRRNRQKCITAQCNPIRGNSSVILEDVKSKIEAIELPLGYELEWGGEYEESTKAQTGVFSGLPVGLMAMALVVVGLFNGFRQPIIIFLVLPLSLIGVTFGLLVTGQPFGFLALLGGLSLAGMLIKNAIVLLDQIDSEIRQGKNRYHAVVDSSVSRIRPVLMASLTTVFGILPLLFDKFWTAMAVTIFFGLTFATVLTLIVVPVLYCIFFRIHPTPEPE